MSESDRYEKLEKDALYAAWRADAVAILERAVWAQIGAHNLECLSAKGLVLGRETAAWMEALLVEYLAVLLSGFVESEGDEYSLLKLLRSMHKHADLLTYERWRQAAGKDPAASGEDEAAYQALWSGPGAQARMSDLQRLIVRLPAGKHRLRELRHGVLSRFDRERSKDRPGTKEILKTTREVYEVARQTARSVSPRVQEYQPPAENPFAPRRKKWRLW